MTSTATPPAIDIETHLKWARAVARGIARWFRFQKASQEERDLEQVAFLCLCRAARRFDPARVPVGRSAGGLFRGWVKPTLAGEVRREARRLLNAGTYHTRREGEHVPVLVEYTGGLLTPEGDPFEPAGREPDPYHTVGDIDLSPPAWSPCWTPGCDGPGGGNGTGP